MGIVARIDGEYWKEFPDGTDESVIRAEGRAERVRRASAAKTASKERAAQPALPQIAPTVPQALEAGAPPLEYGTPVPENPQTPEEMTAENKAGAIRALKVAGPAVGAMLGGGVPALAGLPAALGIGTAALGAGAGQAAVDLATEGAIDPGAVKRETGMTLAMPAFARVFGRPLGRAFAKYAPGSGYYWQREAIKDLQGLPGKYIQTEASDPLWTQFRNMMADYRQAGQFAPSLGTTNTAQAVTNLGADLRLVMTGLQNQGELSVANAIRRLSKPGGAPGAMPIDIWQANMERLRKAVSRQTDPEIRKHLSDLYKAMGRDVDVAAAGGMPEAEVLKRAKDAYHAETVRGEFAQEINKSAVKVLPDDPRVRSAKPGAPYEKLNFPGSESEVALRQRLLQVMDERELGALSNELERIGRQYRKLPGESFMQWTRRVPALLLGGAVGAAAGGVGAAVGGPAAVGVEEAWYRFMRSEAGQRLIERLSRNLVGTGRIAPTLGALLGTATSD